MATCYWHSVEFGLLKDGKDGIRAYGAGLLSSFGELEYACSKESLANGECIFEVAPIVKPWDPEEAAQTSYPITTFQPLYFIADNLSDAKEKMRNFCERLPKPFHARYNFLTNTVWVDRAIKFS